MSDQLAEMDSLKFQVVEVNTQLDQVVEDWRAEQRAAQTLNNEIQVRDTVIEMLSQTQNKQIILIERLQRELESSLSAKDDDQILANKTLDDQVLKLAENRTEILNLQ